MCPELHHGGYQYAPWESARADRAPDPMPALRLQGQADQVVAQGCQRPVHTHDGEASPRKRSESTPVRRLEKNILESEGQM